MRTVELLHARCAGLDVHKKNVVAGVRIAEAGKVVEHVSTFPTVTEGLLALSEFLSRHGVTHVAMEATGVYWRPVWHILSGHFELVLANAAHVKNVPGRKTDVKDAIWLADLLAHGLIRGSFVPPEPIQELRQLTRTRKQLVREIGQHSQRVQKALEDMNIKLGSVVTDVLGVTGRAILRALIEGETDPVTLSAQARGSLKFKRLQLIEALRGRVTDHHRFILKLHLDTIDMLEAQVAEVDRRLGGALAPFQSAIEQLTTIPGVGEQTARVLVSEIGDDMTRFPSAAHLVSWAGLCPRSDESAGKRRSTRTRRASQWLKSSLTQAAWGAARSKGTYLQAQYFRIKARRGAKKAALAVAASIVTAAWHMLRRGTFYEDLGPDHFVRRNKDQAARKLVKRLEVLGYQVSLAQAA
jgi:transposase